MKYLGYILALVAALLLIIHHYVNGGNSNPLLAISMTLFALSIIVPNVYNWIQTKR
jgi:hypothetical protein